jgi:undecaprenyl-diphosphatase
MTFIEVVILAVIQGLAELLPVSSSAHVIVAEKLMGLDPTTPRMVLFLLSLHTGTMFAVIVYFWQAWKKTFFASKQQFLSIALLLIVATACTGVVGLALQSVIKHVLLKDHPGADVEDLFGNLLLISIALFAAGVLILIAGLQKRKTPTQRPLGMKEAGIIGVVQGLTLPFRGFSRSGSTISAGMLLGCVKARVEEFSFALAVILTPIVFAKEGARWWKLRHTVNAEPVNGHALGMMALGLVLAFFAGLVALKWLSRWLETGKWWLFGAYCLIASGVIFAMHLHGV